MLRVITYHIMSTHDKIVPRTTEKIYSTKSIRLLLMNLLFHRVKECRIEPFLQFAEALWSRTWPSCTEHVQLLPRPSAPQLSLTVLPRWKHLPPLTPDSSVRTNLFQAFKNVLLLYLKEPTQSYLCY